MGRTLIVLLTVLLVVLSTLAGLMYYYFISQITSLKNDLQMLQNEYNVVSRNYKALGERYDALTDQYNSLLHNYSKLQNEYKRLQDEYAKLNTEYQSLEGKYLILLSNYESLHYNHTSLLSIYKTLLSNYDEINQQYKDLQLRYEKLSINYKELEDRYTDLLQHFENISKNKQKLEGELKTLSDMYSVLQNSYNTLYANYQQLLSRYKVLEGVVKILNKSMADTVNLLLRYCCIPYAFERVLTQDKVLAIAPYVLAAGVYTQDIWSSIQNIYRWIRNNVKYVHDVPIPSSHYRMCYSVAGSTYCYYNFTEIQNYVQDPEFTARYGQGDCDDQAVLAYAMIMYYMMYIHGKIYNVWIALIEFNDGSAHLAVFIPVAGGMLTIVDPAGAYLTSTTLGVITARSAYEELTRYSNWWGKYGGIRTITLYRVDVVSGKYTLLIEGNISTIAQFIASSQWLLIYIGKFDHMGLRNNYRNFYRTFCAQNCIDVEVVKNYNY